MFNIGDRVRLSALGRKTFRWAAAGMAKTGKVTALVGVITCDYGNHNRVNSLEYANCIEVCRTGDYPRRYNAAFWEKT